MDTGFQWLQLLVRWFHVFAAILWIGQTHLFGWLDICFHKAMDGQDDKVDAEGKVWMVHSGGFYVVEKTKNPGVIDKKLHWFKWEAGLTWLSGATLFVLIFMANESMIVLEDNPWGLDHASSAALGVATIILAFGLYDVLWETLFRGRDKLGVVLCYLGVIGLAKWFTLFFPGRSAFIHMGALFGTIMAANVWMRIIPGQRKMIAAIREGKDYDPYLAERAGRRSKHNSYLVVPVIMIMISNHYPVITFGSIEPPNWVMLSVLVLLGWGIAGLLKKIEG